MNHQGKKPLAIIGTQCSFLRTLLTNALEKAGLWVVQSFNMKISLGLQENCCCSTLYANECTCELVVLLVYPKIGNPATLVLDGREGKTFIFVTDETESQYSTPLIKIIESAIQKAT